MGRDEARRRLTTHVVLKPPLAKEFGADGGHSRRIGRVGVGAALLAADVPAATIRSWCKDPRVALGGGAEGSVFDAFEDLDATECLAKAVEIERVDAFGE